MEPFHLVLLRAQHERADRIASIAAAFAVSPAIILHRRNDQRTLAIRSGDPSEPGRYRVTYLAPDGPHSHATRDTLDACVEDAADWFPISVAPASDDEVIAWTTTPEFVEGAARVAEVQRLNERRLTP